MVQDISTSATASHTVGLIVTARSSATKITSRIADPPNATVAPASDDPNYQAYPPGTSGPAEPIRGDLGAIIIGPENIPIQQQNPDVVASPSTDSGDLPNAKWSFALSSTRMYTGGWDRVQNVDVMPIATKMAGVSMRLAAGTIRELHWHKTAEWAYVIRGSTQITAVDADGRNYVAVVNAGDLWYFPAGLPHSLQATADDPAGSEILIIFPDGNFNSASSFHVTDWLSHVPKEVIAKNFQQSITAFDHIPSRELFMFPSEPPTSNEAPSRALLLPILNGGSVKIVDSTTFKISKRIAMADVTVEPGALRELHWHPTQDEWLYVLEGNARMTIFAAPSTARTFDYQGGDIGYVPAGFGHYLENTGNTTLHFLEIFDTDRFQDISLTQWLALTPPGLVSQTLGLSTDVVAKFSKTKQVVVGPTT
ncbi:oxalate decarboxylase [Russula aff. rugulosa BPL654]|nr:oxalate decarboxylase [Russula aff. rugulosa BPL654]